jgi:hypothetical protein
MCKVLRYHFTCEHKSAHRLSKCRGTTHDHDSEGPSPLCGSSVEFLTFKLADKCGACKQADLEALLKSNISEAEKSLEYLVDTQSPDVPGASFVLDKLKEDFEPEMWNSRVLFPKYKGSTVPQVVLGRFEKKSSPLRYEEQSDEDQDQDQDQDADNSHVSDYYSPEELEQMAGDTEFVADISWGCNWGEANGKENNDQPSAPTSHPSRKQHKPQPGPTPQGMPTTAILSPNFTSPATQTTLSPRQTRFDEQRHQLLCSFDEQLRFDEHLHQMKTKFYTEWLQIARREHQDKERANRRPVPPDPYPPTTLHDGSEDRQPISARASFTAILAAGVLYVCWGNYRRG